MNSVAFDDLPDDAEQAFLILEERFFEELDLIEREYGQDGPPISYYVEYMSKTLSAASTLGLDIFATWSRPNVDDFNHSKYLNFRGDVVSYRTAMQIRGARRSRAFSVRLDDKAKRTINHHIDQIRELLRAANLAEDKRSGLMNKLTAFEKEVALDRTRFDAFGAAMVAFGGHLGDALEASKINSLLGKIAAVIHGAKEEEVRALPPPVERKQIEPPKGTPKVARKTPPETLPKPRMLAEDLDDDIPF